MTYPSSRSWVPLLLILSAGCGSKAEMPSHEGADVVLVTIDTLRADAVGFSGKPAGRDPRARPAGRRGPGVRRRPRPQRRHPPLPRQHSDRPLPVPARGARQQRLRPVRPRAHPRHAAREGRVCDGRLRRRLSAGLPVRPRPGVRRLRRQLPPRVAVPSRSSSPSAAATRSWPPPAPGGTPRRGKRRFLWVHLYDPHAAYDPPEPFASRYQDNLYLGEVAATDSFLAPAPRTLSGRQGAARPGGGHRGPRRVAGRARRADPRPVRLRADAQGAAGGLGNRGGAGTGRPAGPPRGRRADRARRPAARNAPGAAGPPPCWLPHEPVSTATSSPSPPA